MKAKRRSKRLPDRHDKSVPITDKRDLKDLICLELEAGPNTKCETVKWYVLNRMEKFAPKVFDREIHLTKSAWLFFKKQLETYHPKLNSEYESVRKERKAYKTKNRIQQSLKETGEPPKGYRRVPPKSDHEEGNADE